MSTSTTKFTKRDIFSAIRAIAEGSERNNEITDDMIIEFCDKEIASLDAKNVKARERAEKRKAEGDDLLEVVFDQLSDEEFASIADITLKIGDPEITTHKVQYRLKVLVDTGRAERQEITLESENGKTRRVMGYRAL